MRFQISRIEVVPFRFRRNDSWLDSVSLAFRAAVVWAPTTYLRATVNSFGAVVIGIVLVIVNTITWTLTRFVILGAGLCGYISERP